MNELRYSLSDDLKRTISGENETVFRLLESRFCVEIQTRLPGLRIIPKENGDTTEGKQDDVKPEESEQKEDREKTEEKQDSAKDAD